jgi:hypothetical protein
MMSFSMMTSYCYQLGLDPTLACIADDTQHLLREGKCAGCYEGERYMARAIIESGAAEFEFSKVRSMTSGQAS